MREEIAAGAPFDALARQVSVDPSAPAGGLLGPIPAEDLRPEYRSVLAGLEPGKTSVPIALDGALLIFHLVSPQEERWMEQRRAGVEAFERNASGEAEEHLVAAVRDAESLGPTDLRLAQSLAELAGFYQLENRFDDAVPVFERVLDIQSSGLGPDHVLVGETLNNLAEVLRAEQRLAEAEPLYLRALANMEGAFGPDHTNVAVILNNLALLHQAEGQYARAQPLFRQSLEIMESNLGLEDPTLGPTLANLGRAYHAQSNFTEAARSYRRALSLLEPALGAADPALLEVRRFLTAAARGAPMPVESPLQ